MKSYEKPVLLEYKIYIRLPSHDFVLLHWYFYLFKMVKFIGL